MRFTVKLGGSLLDDESSRIGILEQICQIQKQGHEIILVHGGGKNLNRRLSQIGLASRFLDGLRVTDEPTLAVAVMVLAGEVNKSLVATLAGFGSRAVGICGADAGAVECERVRNPAGDLGFVGRPVRIRRDFLDLLLGSGFIPVISSIAIGTDCQLYNVNADQMASICAWGAGCRSLVYLTDVDGVRDASGAVLPRIGRRDIEALRSEGTISGGMLPKTQSCLEALEHGVEAVHVLPGSAAGILHSFVMGTLTNGTCIYGN